MGVMQQLTVLCARHLKQLTVFLSGRHQPHETDVCVHVIFPASKQEYLLFS